MAGFLFGAAGMFAAMYSTQAILPQIAREFEVGAVAAGLTVSGVVAGVALGALLWGPFSDRFGRKRSIVLASTLIVVPSVGAAIAPTFELLVACRVLQGLCMPGLLAVSVPYVAEVFVPRLGGRAMGSYVAATVAGGLLGRVGVGLSAATVGWRPAIAGLALLNAGAAVSMRRAPPEPPPRPAIGAAGTLRSRALVRATVAGAALFFTFVCLSSYVGFRLAGRPFGLSPTEIALFFTLWTLGAIGPVAGRLADRFGWDRVLAGALLTAAGGIALTLPERLPLLVVGLGILTLAMFGGVTAANLGVAGAVPGRAGSASGAYFTIYYLAGALGAYLPGYAWEAWGWTGVVAVGLIVLGSATVALVALGTSGGRPGRERTADVGGGAHDQLHDPVPHAGLEAVERSRDR